MKVASNPALIFKPFLFLLSFSLFLLLLFFQLNPKQPPQPLSTTVSTTILSSSSLEEAAAANSTTTSTTNPLIKIRGGYRSYDEYIAHQLSKTLNPRLRHLWSTRDWARKVTVFSSFFASLRARHLLSNSSRCLCVGARLGQEVAALRAIGVADSLGIDLVPSPPLVVRGDFHHHPFTDSTFDFQFSNVFDHALYPDRFVGEIERTLKEGGVCVLHVALHRRGDKYSANDLLGVDGVIGLFKHSELVGVRKVDGFGLDTEIVFRKKKKKDKLLKMKTMRKLKY